MTKDKKIYCTNLYPKTLVSIDGPCAFEIKNINSFGQIEFVFIVPLEVSVKQKRIEEKDATKKK